MPNSTGLSRCTVQRPDTTFCDADTIEDAPFPICVKHASELYGHLDAAVASYATAEALAPPDAPLGAVVYYLAVSGLIKIGTTVNLSRRLREYPPNAELLAHEPGGHAVESRRHRSFEHLRAYANVSREWYVDVPALRAEITRISRGEAPLSAPPERAPYQVLPPPSTWGLTRLEGLRRGGEGTARSWDTAHMRGYRARTRHNKR